MRSMRTTPIPMPMPGDSGFLDRAVDLPYWTQRSPLRPYIGVILYCLTLLAYAGLLFFDLLPWFSHKSVSFAFRAAAMVLLLPCTALLERYLTLLHRRWQRRGYLSFYRDYKAFLRVPLVVVMTGVTITLVLATWPDSFCRVLHLSPLNTLRLLFCLEVAVLLWNLVIYCSAAHQLQTLQSPPDVHEALLSALRESDIVGAQGMDEGEEVMERQAELIRFQQESFRQLSKEVLRLQEKLSKYERTGELSSSRSDLEHWLSAREQEVRALTAERDQLSTELRSARLVIAEKEGLLQELRNSNQQYVNESVRLRAMLDEWSARSAKLELLLETERAAVHDLKKKAAKPGPQS